MNSSASPGRVGPGHLISPPAPMIPCANGTLATTSFMVKVAVRQPLAGSPAKKVSSAASASLWNGYGSNWIAYSTISSVVSS